MIVVIFRTTLQSNLLNQIVELLFAELRKMSLIPHAFGRRSNVFDPFLMDEVDAFGWPSSFMSGRSGCGSSSEMAPFVHARIDWKETSNAHVFQADMPGMRKEEVKVEVEDGRVLAISGEKRKEMEEKGDMWHRVERSSGKFSRKFKLPENAKVEEVKASMENGVLTVTVPKNPAEKKANIKSIQISG